MRAPHRDGQTLSRMHVARRSLSLILAATVALTVVPSSNASAASAKRASVSVRVAGCDVGEEDVSIAEELGFTYLADELEGPCKITATLRPRTPRRPLVLQRFDEEREIWVNVAKKNASKTGAAGFSIDARSEESCFDFEVTEYRVAVPRAGKNPAAYSSSFTVALLSDPDSPACTEEPTDEGDGGEDLG